MKNPLLHQLQNYFISNEHKNHTEKAFIITQIILLN